MPTGITPLKTDEPADRKALEHLRWSFTEAQRLLSMTAANEALLPLREILRDHPDHPDALNLTSVAFGQLGMAEEAVSQSRRAIQLRPEDAGFHLNLANRLNDLKRPDDAILSYEAAHALAPDNIGILKSYLRCLTAHRRWSEACGIVDRLLPLIGDSPDLLAECADVCIGNGNQRRALDLYQRALAHEPEQLPWLLQLARLAINLDDTTLARETGERVLELEENAEMRAMIASILHRFGDLEAMADYLDAIPEGSDQAGNAANLQGLMKVSQGKTREGLDHMALTATVVPDAFPIQATRVMYLNYDPNLSRTALCEAHLAFGRRFNDALPKLPTPSTPPDPERRLRLGFVSPDLRGHSVAYFVGPFFEAFDRTRFDVVAYANLSGEDGVSDALRAQASTWHNIFELSDQALADKIRDDRIDILIDLAGLTRDNRLLAFTARPAPIQMSYIGYPNTTGFDAIDYRITDAIADPEGADQDYSETLIRLPGCFLAYAIPNHAPPLEPGPAEHRDYVTFGSFNNFAKINAEVLAVWADILHAVPNSRFLFKSTSSSDPIAQDVVRTGLAKHGINPSRISFCAFRQSAQSHLAVYNDVDIALDPFPYNGTTTTCEALWMGVPVVTLKGDRHAGRVGASLLTAIGFNAGIAETRDDYILTARLLAENRGMLKTARRSLRDTVMQSSLCDRDAHARKLEEAFRAVWRIWCEEGPDAPRALKPAPFHR